jgi:hypothetical protein
MAALITFKSYFLIVRFVGATVFIAFVLHRSDGQVVSIGPQDPNYCQKVERILPNLILKQNAHVYGVVSEDAENPIVRREVVLKSYRSPSNERILRTVQTDDVGRFDFGDLVAGRYRLVASWTRAFRQPNQLQCPKSSDCDLSIQLKALPTDGPDSVCPVK